MKQRSVTSALIGLICLSVSSLSHAGGFDNSSRYFGIILDSPGKENELRLSYQVIAPSISGDVQQNIGASNTVNQVSEVVPTFQNLLIGWRFKVSDDVSCATRYEEPYKTDVRYQDDTLSFQSDPLDPATQIFSPNDSFYDSESLSFACRYTWQDDTQRFHIFLGPKYQEINGAFSSDLSSFNLGSADDLNVYLNGGSEWGYLAGAAYEIPSIALRVALFYHSEIEYDLTGESFTPLPDFSSRVKNQATGKTLTPQSIQLSFRSGIADAWLAYLDFTWAEWSKVREIQVVDNYGNPRLALFENDTLEPIIGIAHALTDNINLGFSYSTSLRLGGDSTPPNADGVNLRNPQGDRHTFSFGGEYKLSKKISMDLTLGYTLLEKKTIIENRTAGDVFIASFEESKALSATMGLSWFY